MKTSTLLLVAAAGVGAWWMFGRSASAAPSEPMPQSQPPKPRSTLGSTLDAVGDLAERFGLARPLSSSSAADKRPPSPIGGAFGAPPAYPVSAPVLQRSSSVSRFFYSKE